MRTGRADSAEGQSARETRAAALSRINNPLKALVFSWVLRNARDRVRDRENLRFERTRLFGRVRQIVRELGRHLAADGQIENADDVFYLNLEEVLSPHDATLTTTDLKALVRIRRAEFDDYRSSPAPPDRFQTRGSLHRYQEFESELPPLDLTGDTRQGVGACAGIVRGPVRVVGDPREATLAPHEILVAQQTDPGWVILFPSAAGLLVERGSLLSHSAIVSREMNLPCIVSLSHITSWLTTGDWVEMDGKTGLVRKIARDE
jgi:pyruvate,water dikinase